MFFFCARFAIDIFFIQRALVQNSQYIRLLNRSGVAALFRFYFFRSSFFFIIYLFIFFPVTCLFFSLLYFLNLFFPLCRFYIYIFSTLRLFLVVVAVATIFYFLFAGAVCECGVLPLRFHSSCSFVLLYGELPVSFDAGCWWCYLNVCKRQISLSVFYATWIHSIFRDISYEKNFFFRSFCWL